MALRSHYAMAHLMRTAGFRPTRVLIRLYNKIVITDDGSTIVGLHRDQEFPYEHSKPLPEEVKDDSILKMSDYREVKRVFNDMTPEMARQHLSAMTLTTKHRWFPRSRDKKANNTEMDRTYL